MKAKLTQTCQMESCAPLKVTLAPIDKSNATEIDENTIKIIQYYS